MMTSAVLAVAVLLAQSGQPPRPEPQSQPAAASAPLPTTAPGVSDPGRGDALAMQVMLDRAGFSPGPIDGRIGANTKKAMEQYQRQNPGADAPAVEPVTTCTITEADVAGPFVASIPADLVQQASLPALSYTSVLEALAERYHSTPALLRQLNPTAQFVAGEQIQVPNVEPLVAPVAKPDSLTAAPKEPQPAGTTGRRGPSAPRPPNPIMARPDVVVTISRSQSAVTVQDPSGRTMFYAPVTTGSEHDPLPIGEWKVNGIQLNPSFNYNPELFWDADPAHAKARLPPGPNNPVGLVWIALSKEHYGIHGTPEPTAIGRTQSHGCVRLTNWDALKLAGLVKPGTRVVFSE